MEKLTEWFYKNGVLVHARYGNCKFENGTLYSEVKCRLFPVWKYVLYAVGIVTILSMISYITQ